MKQSPDGLLRLTPMRLLALAMLIAGIGPVLVRESPVDPAATGFWRLIIALPFAIWLGHANIRFGLRDTLLAILAGLLLGWDLVLWNNAILKTSVMEATVLVMLFPIIVAGAEIGFLGKRLSTKLLIGGAVAFLGTAVIAFSGGAGESSFVGDMMAVAAAVLYAGSLLISATLVRRIDNRSVTPWVVLGGALGALPFGWTESRLFPDDLYGWGYLATYGILTFISYALYNSALSRLPTTLVAISAYGQPVIATGLAIILLSEFPSLTALIGAAIVIAGLLIATVDREAH
jgi:drug/metabolite transporter (DMT)-like permease